MLQKKSACKKSLNGVGMKRKKCQTLLKRKQEESFDD